MSDKDAELVADLFYIYSYAKQLADKVYSGAKLAKVDQPLAQRMAELASKALGNVNVLTGPW